MKKLILFIIVLTSIIEAQDYRKRLFSEVDNIKLHADSLHSAQLSPGFYTEALEYYVDAQSGLKDGDDLEDIRELVSKAKLYFERAIKSSEIAQSLFENSLEARDDGLAVGADTLSEKEWNQGEKKLNSAAVEIENNDEADAEELAFEAEKFYRSAELNAIKFNYLNETWKLHKQADDLNVRKIAPITLENSINKINFAEKELEENRYDNDYAKNMADDAYAEAKHALNIAELINRFDDEDKTQEDIILYYEKPLRDIAAKLDLDARFDDGYQNLTDKIIQKISEYYRLKDENADLKASLNRYKKQMQDLASEKNEISSRLRLIEDYETRYNDVKKMFTPSEARVLRKEGNIIIRLTSIKFASGSSVISPKYFSVLTKVQNSIKKFPESHIVVEGHTDSDGKSDKNLSLSQRRADAVFQYLFANLDIERDQIYAVGFGETKPIASNETDAGKEKNRRIDIIIKP